MTGPSRSAAILAALSARWRSGQKRLHWQHLAKRNAPVKKPSGSCRLKPNVFGCDTEAIAFRSEPGGKAGSNFETKQAACFRVGSQRQLECCRGAQDFSQPCSLTRISSATVTLVFDLKVNFPALGV